MPGSLKASANVWSVTETPANVTLSVERNPDKLPDP